MPAVCGSRRSWQVLWSQCFLSHLLLQIPLSISSFIRFSSPVSTVSFYWICSNEKSARGA